MVQGASRNSSTGVALTNQDKKHEKPDAHTARKAVPTKRKPVGFYDKTNHEITSSIGRNIETVMAARLVHEGGRLTVIPMPENVDKFDTSRARISSRQMADLKRATKARMGRQQRDGTNAIVAAAKNPKKSKNNKLGPKKGYGGVDSDDEEYRKIKDADDDEIIPRDDVLTPETSDDETPEGLERKLLSKAKREERLKLLQDAQNGLISPEPAPKRRKAMDGQKAAPADDSEDEDEDDDGEDEQMQSGSDNGADDDSDDDDDEPTTKKKGVQTMLGSWLDQRRKKTALGKSSASSTSAVPASAPVAKPAESASKPAAPKPKAAAKPTEPAPPAATSTPAVAPAPKGAAPKPKAPAPKPAATPAVATATKPAATAPAPKAAPAPKPATSAKKK